MAIFNFGLKRRKWYKYNGHHEDFSFLGTDTDQIVLNELTLEGYLVYHKPIRGRKRWCVEIIAKLNLKIVSVIPEMLTRENV